MKPLPINNENVTTIRDLLSEICPHFCIDYKVYYDGELLTINNLFKYENYKVLAWRVMEDITEGIYIELFSTKQ